MITLKNIKVHEDMSQETTCFSATIYVGGKRIGEVRNDGHGGPNFYHWLDAELGRQVHVWAEAQPTEFKFEKLDQLVGRLLSRTEAARLIARQCKRQTVFFVAGDPPGEARTLKSAPFTPAAKAHLVRKYGDRLLAVANEDQEKAVDLLLADAAAAAKPRGG